MNCSDYKYVVSYYLITITQNGFSSLTSLHVLTEEHDNIMGKIIEEKALDLRYQYQ